MTQLNNETKPLINKGLILKLYKTSKKDTIAPSFRARLSAKSKHYPELEGFKIQLEEEQNDRHPHLYSEVKQKLFNYRLVFMTFALLFMCLSGAVSYLSFNWHYTFIFDTTIKGKWIACSLISMLSLASFCCAYFPSALNEATHQVVNKAKRTIRHFYEKQRIKHNLTHFSLWGEEYRKSCALQHMQKEIFHKIEEYGEQTLRLLKKVACTGALSPKAKERLYNQALAELHDKLSFSVNTFQQLDLETSTHLQLA